MQRQWRSRTGARRLSFLAVWLALPASLHGRAPDDAPALPAPRGKVVTIATVEGLYRALANLESNTTVVIQKGEYRLHRPIHLSGRLKNVSIRGATGHFEDVILRGAGMNNTAVHHGVLVDDVNGLVIADVTIGWVGYHPIALQPKCDRVLIRHCRLVDAGEQFIKCSSDGRGGGVDDGIVEYCVLEYSKDGPPNGYTNGVDVHGGKNWIIRHNLFRNIRTPRGAKYKHVPAVLMWNGSANTICEANTFINCDRAVAFGLVQREGFADHHGGIIRNNFIYVGKNEVPHVDCGIYVVSADSKVLHNTIVLNGGYPNAVEARWSSTTGVTVRNNVTDARIVSRNGAGMSSNGNVTDARPSLFKNAAAGDLHFATNGPRCRPHPDCPRDWDELPRGAKETTVGADEPVSR